MNIRDYPCSECDYAASSSTYLRRHKRYKHDKVKDGKCHLCNKEFPTEKYLKEHILNVHEGANFKQFPCEDCATKFSRKESLDLHYRYKHSGQISNIYVKFVENLALAKPP